MLIKTIKRKPSYNSELTSLPIVTPFAENRSKVPPTCRCGVKHVNVVSSSFVIRNNSARQFVKEKRQPQELPY